MQKKILITALVLIATGIALGAFGRHYFEEKLGKDGVSGFDTAVRYQVWHGLVFLFLSLFVEKISFSLSRIYWGLLSGTILFSGSIYVIVILKTLSYSSLPLPLVLCTPLGGTVLILTWVYFLILVIIKFK